MGKRFLTGIMMYLEDTFQYGIGVNILTVIYKTERSPGVYGYFSHDRIGIIHLWKSKTPCSKNFAEIAGYRSVWEKRETYFTP